MTNNHPERKKRITEVRKFWFHKLPNQLNGHVVAVDAYASSANMSIILAKHPKRLIVVNEGNLGKAHTLYKDSILVGESLNLPPEAFAFPNELKAMHEGQVGGKNVLWMSINGSRVLEKAMQITRAGDVLAGAFNNVKALVDYLLASGGKVNIIMAGNQGAQLIEDEVCAQMIESRLLGLPFDWETRQKEVSDFVRQYYPRTAEQDIPYLLGRVDAFKIVPKIVVNSDGFLEVKDGSRSG